MLKIVWLSRGILDEICKYIAGEIVLSQDPGKVMRKWREFFEISQTDLAVRLGTSPSVISDYELGRRRSPGSQFIRRLVNALISIELERGGVRLQLLARQLMSGEKYWIAIIDMRDFEKPILLQDLVNVIQGMVIVEPEVKYLYIHGYTIVDSLKLVLEVPPQEYFKLYGSTTQRAAIFTNVKYGRSPLVAIKTLMAFSNLRPIVVILHGIEKPDYLGIEIAKREKIPLVVTNIQLEEMVKNLRKLGKEL